MKWKLPIFFSVLFLEYVPLKLTFENADYVQIPLKKDCKCWSDQKYRLTDIPEQLIGHILLQGDYQLKKGKMCFWGLI